MRQCELCGNKDNPQVLYQDNVACSQCGFVYTNTDKTQADLNSYYASLPNYSGEPNAMDVFKNKCIVQTLLDAGIDKKAPLLDVGCGNGYLLSLLHDQGFSQLRGLDPHSSVNHKHIPIDKGIIFNYSTEQRFDVIILNHVIEHIIDLNGAAQAIRRLLPPNGILFLEFPNLSLYAERCQSPFTFISDEHVNHFSIESLIRFFGRYGFVEKSHGIRPQTVSSYVMLTKQPCAAADTSHFTNYLRLSQDMISGVVNKVNGLLESNEPIYIWGAGHHLNWLQTNTNIMQCNIIDIIDRDIVKQNDTIKSPDAIVTGDRILITPHYLANDIQEQIKSLGLTNDSFTLW